MIKNFFLNDINRTIETVIKADDREHVSDEVAEYVITHEIAKKIRDFFSAYNDYAGANGVWISGFFGSGKSHLLKILSYVLENKKFDGYESGELFAEKIEGDEMLKADVLKATKRPSESILFNIDQQAQITSKSDENAILSVFYKVFYDHLGFYGFRPHVAEFEMWLNKLGQYNDFKTKFKTEFGKSWEEARLDYHDPLVEDAVAKVLGEINNTDSSKYIDVLDKLEDNEKQSIEDFANRVKTYLDSKGNGFRLNFFVDEVGQYISDNTKLMLNLQTIAETLATRTQGNSWILVTSQEDMEKVVGDMNKSQQNDFSRIQARFKIKIPLTSANVDEVIEKRLLKKKEDIHKNLATSFKKESAHLESLLSFSEAGVQFKGYKNGDDFSNKFPLVPYQFDLFQQCRRALSTHNAFQGKHASVGERSMLGVFQQVIQHIEKKGDNALVSFDLMYEGIRNELRGEIQSSVIMAERNLDNKFAIKVLKALFLVKYFGNFKTTKRNISVLLIDDIHVDIKEHEKQIDEALNILENQSYVQRNGDFYEFLTDDEKDVEEEIKNTDIDDQAITQFLKEILFDEIIRDNRINYLDNKQDYDFTSKLDGVMFGREKELEIELITENYNDYDNITFIQSQTMGSTGMKLVLSSDAVFMKDVKMYLRTGKYVKQNLSTSMPSERKRILQDKAQQNSERKRNLTLLANNGLAASTVYMNGAKHEVAHTTDGKTKVIKAFQDLIKTVYSSLRMLGTTQYSEDTIKTTVRSTQDDLFGADDSTMSEAESEVLNLINRRKNQADRTSLNDIRTHFSRKPYGWYPNAIWTIVARLYKRGKVEVMQGSNNLEDEEVLGALLNSAKHSTTLLEPQANFDSGAVKALKQTYKDAFDESCPFKEAKDVALDFRDKLNQMSVDVNQILARRHEYHFLESLDSLSDRLDKLSKKEYSYFITNLKDFEDELLETKEDLLDPIKRFINGDQIKIYDDVQSLLKGNTANFGYIEGDELETLETLVKSNTPYKGNGIQLAKAAKDSLTKKVLEAINVEKDQFNTKIDAIEKDIKDSDEFGKIDSSQQSDILGAIKALKTKIKNERFIGNIRDEVRKVDDHFYSDQMNKMAQWLAPKGDDGKAKEPKAKYIKRSNIHIDFNKRELQTEEDVEAYLDALKEAYMERINQNLKITL
ncbi:BREX system P-loop protein BrxC [Aequorivita flava]|uniref:BREX system P-loop protein BrxC n=1 Tax=Aequorivita flava TaxID=3114371 RepID=A0AB35YV56_9FLAO